MIVEDQLIPIRINKYSVLNNYRDKGYKCNLHDTLYVKPFDLSCGSHSRVKVICDYCGKEFEMYYQSYVKQVTNGFLHKAACSECRLQKTFETNLIKYGSRGATHDSEILKKQQNSFIEKYGVHSPSLIPEVQEKRRNTFLEKYGVENPFQADICKEKAKETCRNKYGVDYAMQYPEIKEKMKSTLLRNGSVKTSIGQEKLCSLLNGTLNYQIGYYCVDILLNNNIVIEYDGSGHDMTVLFHYLTREEFDSREKFRENYIVSNGYKIIRFINKHDKDIFQLETIEPILTKAKELLKESSVVRYDFDFNNFI